MSYKVQFVGLVCFYRERGGRQVLLPDGRNPGPGTDPHYPKILIDPKALLASSGWQSDEDTAEGIYEIPPAWVSFEGTEEPGALDLSKHDGLLPQLRQFAPQFEIDPDAAQSVARLRIRRGQLSAHVVPGGSAVMSQLIVPHDGPITVTVRPTDGSETRTLRLFPGTEIVLGNMAAGRFYDPNQSAHGHFKIYEKLSVRPVVLNDPDEKAMAERTKTLPELDSGHWLFDGANRQNLSVSCSNTGCC